MKKILVLLIASVLLLGLAACGGGEDKEESTTAAAQGQTTTEEATAPAGEAGILTLVAVFNAGEGEEGRKDYPVEFDDYEGDGYSVWEMSIALSELTGLNFNLLDVAEDSAGMTVTWAPESTLFGMGDSEQKEEFFFFDYDSMAWFMLDSLCQTIVRNIPAMAEKDIFYAMEGGGGLVLENLSPPMDFTLETPYMGSAFYFAHADGRGDIIDDEPVG